MAATHHHVVMESRKDTVKMLKTKLQATAAHNQHNMQPAEAKSFVYVPKFFNLPPITPLSRPKEQLTLL